MQKLYKAGELDVHDLTRLTQHDPRNQFSWPAQAMVSCRKEIAQFILNNVAKE